jgi:uncharacterized protein YkwD
MHRLILLLILLASVDNLFAQADRELDLDNPNLLLLGAQTFHAVNDLRLDKKTPALQWDEVLYRAAKDHADYLIKEKKLSHEQRFKDRSTPFKRVKLHGGLTDNRVGENLVSVSLGIVVSHKGRKLSTQSVNSAALTMAQLWKASPSHYRNILEKSFNATAVAIAYEPKSQRVIAVQVFAAKKILITAEELPDRSEVLLHTPERKLPFGLKGSNEFSKKNSRSIRAFLTLSSVNGYLTGSYKAGKRAFKGRRSAIAVESIPLTQFDSGATDYDLVRNRRNGLYPLNGELQKPVYRREMLRYSRRHSPRFVFLNLRILKIHKRIKAFIYPTTAGPGTNLFLINKKKLTTYVTPLGLPALLLDEPLPLLKFRNSFSNASLPERFKKETKYDTLELTVFYASRVVTTDTATTQKIIRVLEKTRGKIIRVEAAAYASVDGEMSENHGLAKQRVNGLMAVIKPYLDTINVTPHLVSKEQWELFLQQIERHNLWHLKKVHKRELRSYVNTHKTDSLISLLLAEQRFTLFKMIIKYDSLIPLPIERAVENYYKQKNKFEPLETKTASQAAILEKAQLKAYGEIIAKNTSEVIKVVNDERYPAFRYHELMFNYMIRHQIPDHQFYKQLHELGHSKYLAGELRSQLVYNNLVFIYRNYDNEKYLSSMMMTEDLYCNRYRRSEFLVRHYKHLQCWRNETLFSQEYYVLKEFPHLISLDRKQNIQHSRTDSLSKFYTTSMIKALYSPLLPTEIFAHVANVKPLFHPDDNALSLDERVRLAFFYCAFYKVDVAKSLLAPVINDSRLDPEGRKLFITLQFDAYHDQHEVIDYLIDQYSILGKQHWCNMWSEGKYLTYLLLEDVKLKKFYNCQCQSGGDE